MAELLIHKQGRGDPTDDLDYQPFDVVVIRPDGWPWGSRETDGITFLLVKLPGVPVDQIKRLVESSETEVDGQITVTKRRRFWISWFHLPDIVKVALDIGIDSDIRAIVPEIIFAKASDFLDTVREK